MLLDINGMPSSMKPVYSLAEELRRNPERVQLAQALTLDESRPFIGLKGTHGLFGSNEWWASIKSGITPVVFVSGEIRRAYVAGQDQAAVNNSVDLISPNGEIVSVGIYVNDEEDIVFFREGSWVEMVYALDELKMQPARDGGTNFSKVALEVAVSLQPVR